MINLSAFAESLKSDNCEILVNSPMSRQTSFRVGGNADIIAFPKNENELVSILKNAAENNVPCIVIGNGSNLLIKDCGIKGLVVKTTAMDPKITVDGDIIRCSAGASLSKLCMAALENSLTGLEFAYGIPGSVGGAVFMNAGAYGGEIKDVITKCDYIAPDGVSGQLSKEDMLLGYRTSVFNKNNCVISGAYFKLNKDSQDAIKERMNDFLARRKSKQPLEYPSAGSTFKRPEGYFAGALIEQSGLKGFSVGGAQVSEKHAGFVINKGDATARDVMDLVEYIRKKVKEDSGVDLEPEIRIFS